MTPDEYLRRPYHCVFIWDDPTQTWTGMIKEFPGCVCQIEAGKDPLGVLYTTAVSWIEAALSQGQTIPEPEK